MIPEPEDNGRLLVALDDFIPRPANTFLAVPMCLTMPLSKISQKAINLVTNAGITRYG
jgi:hypothetical protein